MINRKIPVSANYIPASVSFSATFSAGVYDFSIAGNTSLPVIPLNPNSRYYIDRLSIGANISKELFLAAIANNSGALNLPPALQFKKKLTGENVYCRDIPIIQLYEDKEASVFISSHKAGESLTLSMTGKLYQVADLVGISFLAVNVELAIYEISLQDYNIWFDGAKKERTF